jgi:hypothetical protein
VFESPTVPEICGECSGCWCFCNHQTSLNAETQLPGYGLAGYRPAVVALSGDQFYCSVFKGDVVGPWVERHGMTASDYQAEFDKQNANGFYPICLEGGGVGDQTRYAAIFGQLSAGSPEDT